MSLITNSAESVAESSLKLAELLSTHDRRYRDLLEALPAAIYTTDADGIVTFYNRAAVELAGREPQIGKDKWCVTWRLFHTDGRALPFEECPMAIALKENRPVRNVEAVAERPDGSRVHLMPYPTPLRDASGALTGAVNMLMDISERKRSQEQQALLVRELAHRVNNTLAVILAITQQSLRTAELRAAFAETFPARIQALAKAHELLLAGDWQGAELGELARAQVVPLVPGLEDRFRIGGPLVMLSPAQATSLALVLHELGTNATKHGSLSDIGGTVEITWRLHTNGGRRLKLTWVEAGGPPVKQPKRKGLGSRLIKNALPGARVDWRFEPSGLICTLDLVLESPVAA